MGKFLRGDVVSAVLIEQAVPLGSRFSTALVTKFRFVIILLLIYQIWI